MMVLVADNRCTAPGDVGDRGAVSTSGWATPQHDQHGLRVKQGWFFTSE